MAAITAERAHFRGLSQKAGTLYRCFRNRTPLFMAEPAFSRISSGQITGTAPARVQSQTMLAGDMFVISLFMAAPAYFCINRSIAPDNGLMVGSMTGFAIDLLGMSAVLPLLKSCRSFLLMAIDAI